MQKKKKDVPPQQMFSQDSPNTSCRDTSLTCTSSQNHHRVMTFWVPNTHHPWGTTYPITCGNSSVLEYDRSHLLSGRWCSRRGRRRRRSRGSWSRCWLCLGSRSGRGCRRLFYSPGVVPEIIPGDDGAANDDRWLGTGRGEGEDFEGGCGQTWDAWSGRLRARWEVGMWARLNCAEGSNHILSVSEGCLLV